VGRSQGSMHTRAWGPTGSQNDKADSSPWLRFQATSARLLLGLCCWRSAAACASAHWRRCCLRPATAAVWRLLLVLPRQRCAVATSPAVYKRRACGTPARLGDGCARQAGCAWQAAFPTSSSVALTNWRPPWSARNCTSSVFCVPAAVCSRDLSSSSRLQIKPASWSAGNDEK
jgi:hypothetical protein